MVSKISNQSIYLHNFEENEKNLKEIDGKFITPFQFEQAKKIYKDFYDIDKNTVIIINNIHIESAIPPFQFFTAEFEAAPNPINITFHEVGLYNEVLSNAEISYITKFYKQKYGQVPT